MKQQDIAILIVVVFFAGILSFVVSGKFINSDNKQRTAEVVSAITSEFPLPDSAIFNSDAINPTVRIEIAPNSNNQPFVD